MPRSRRVTRARCAWGSPGEDAHREGAQLELDHCRRAVACGSSLGRSSDFGISRRSSSGRVSPHRPMREPYVTPVIPDRPRHDGVRELWISQHHRLPRLRACARAQTYQRHRSRRCKSCRGVWSTTPSCRDLEAQPRHRSRARGTPVCRRTREPRSSRRRRADVHARVLFSVPEQRATRSPALPRPWRPAAWRKVSRRQPVACSRRSSRSSADCSSATRTPPAACEGRAPSIRPDTPGRRHLSVPVAGESPRALPE